jgi:RNA polymerase sigma factor (sigma-70 family)
MGSSAHFEFRVRCRISGDSFRSHIWGRNHQAHFPPRTPTRAVLCSSVPQSEDPQVFSSATAAGPAYFATTHWSVVVAAGQKKSALAGEALEALCRSYWTPVYAYLRRKGQAHAEAQDLTQEFFAWLLHHEVIGAADRERGRFRSFLLGTLRHFLSGERERSLALKRGGGSIIISLEELTPERRQRLELMEPAATPEDVFDRRWAVTVLERALTRLRAEQEAAGKAAEFDRLKTLLLGDKTDEGQAALAESLGLTPGALRVALHRLRQRFREIVRSEVARTVAHPAVIDEEIRHLAAVIGKQP